LMIIVAVGLAGARIVWGIRKVRQGQKELRDKIAGLNEPVQEAK